MWDEAGYSARSDCFVPPRTLVLGVLQGSAAHASGVIQPGTKGQESLFLYSVCTKRVLEKSIVCASLRVVLPGVVADENDTRAGIWFHIQTPANPGDQGRTLLLPSREFNPLQVKPVPLLIRFPETLLP